jgi:hypothetical protein
LAGWKVGKLLLLLFLLACNPAQPVEKDRDMAATPGQATGEAANLQAVEVERDPDVPELPFADNPDPALCGIPQPWGNSEPAYLNGIYEGKLVQPAVFLYDSHLRRKIQAQAPHGAQVKILLTQSNPTLDYYLVKVDGAEPPNEGWVPAPFLVFEPPPPLP